MIVRVNEQNLTDAAFIHSASWQDSHRTFCSEAFVALHDVPHQQAYLRREMDAGKAVWMLIADRPVGIVSVTGSLIENLYVLPEAQGMGYGTRLLRHAIAQCAGRPCLWILDNNHRARALYERNGFILSGNRNALTDTLSELEMVLS